MALNALDPLTCETFESQPGVGPFRDWVCEQVAGDDGDGWQQSVESYSWYAYQYDLTLTARKRQGDRLREAATDTEWHAACEWVREWSGEPRPFETDQLDEIKKSCAK